MFWSGGGWGAERRILECELTGGGGGSGGLLPGKILISVPLRCLETRLKLSNSNA